MGSSRITVGRALAFCPLVVAPVAALGCEVLLGLDEKILTAVDGSSGDAPFDPEGEPTETSTDAPNDSRPDGSTGLPECAGDGSLIEACGDAGAVNLCNSEEHCGHCGTVCSKGLLDKTSRCIRGECADFTLQDWKVPTAQTFETRNNGEIIHDVNTGIDWETSRFVSASVSPEDYCATHNVPPALAGFSDWRLPTRVELESLVEYARTPPTIDPLFSLDTSTKCFWTSSITPDNMALVVEFDEGSITIESGNIDACAVRCARRDHGIAKGRFEHGNENTTYDATTDLTWESALVPNPHADGGLAVVYDDAARHCQDLAIRDQKPWRVPTIFELSSIVNERRTVAPMIDLDAFPGTPPEGFWSATASRTLPTGQWLLAFDHAITFESNRNGGVNYVRCVRTGK